MSVSGRAVTVIGAGIGGLATARALALRGAQVTVLEQADAITEVGAGLQISPNGFRVIDALGLGPALLAQSVRAEAVSLRDYRVGSEVLRLDLTRLAGDQHYLFVHRADLIDILAEGARAAGADIRLGQTVTAIEAGAPPRVVTDRGVLSPALLIGADGLRSTVRAALNGKSAPFFTRQVAWRAIVPNSAAIGPEAQVHMGPGRHLVSYPLRGGAALNLVAVQERSEWAAEGWDHADDPANLRAAFRNFGGPLRDVLEEVTEVRLWGLFRHPVAPVWQDGATAILGDAAHPTLPFLAQGANLALEDAWVLADALATGASVEQGLATYQQRRQERVRRVVEAASRNAWKYHLSFPPLRLAAHLALAAGGRLVPGRMLAQFDWLYGHDVTRPADAASG
jgi:salicylate hydroxylase